MGACGGGYEARQSAGAPVKRPVGYKADKRKFKTKKMQCSLSDEELRKLSDDALYRVSEYHCPVDGRPPKRRRKPASHCPDFNSLSDAKRAVRKAILEGKISERWTRGKEYPRYIWYKAGQVWYEGRTEDGSPGVYHGYPIEEIELPEGLEP